MTAVFERILDMSLTAAVVIAAVLLIRLLLAKAPKKWSYALWSVAAFRLVCPVSFRSVFSLFSLTERVEEAVTAGPAPAPLPTGGAAVPPVTTAPPVVATPIPTAPVATAPAVSAPAVSAPVTQAPVAPAFDWAAHAMDIAAVIWLIGLAALVTYGVVSYLRLCRRMDTATLMEGRVWQSERVQSPFILGFIKPKIYIPYRLAEEQQRYVLAHENYHIKRLDHITRPLSFFVLAAHWFNPLVWLAYYLAGRDMEMSCDEKVLSKGESAKSYSATLLSFAANRRLPALGPLAFGEQGVKGRVKNALHWRKPRMWVTAIALILCVAVIAACAADPEEPGEEKSYRSAQCVYLSSLSSQFAKDDSGLDYIIGPDRVVITRRSSDEVVAETTDMDWQPVTEEWWREDFSMDILGDSLWEEVAACKAPRCLTVGTYCLLDLDGTYWAGVRHSHPDGSPYWWDIYLLVEESQAVRTYHSAECIFVGPFASALPPADNGLEYVVAPDRAAIVDYNGDTVAETTDMVWLAMDFDWWMDASFGTGLAMDGNEVWEQVSACQRPRYLMVDEQNYLMDLDGTYWAGVQYRHPNGTPYWSRIYRLEEGKRDPGGEPEGGITIPGPVYTYPVSQAKTVLADWAPDLNHDGKYDDVTVNAHEDGVTWDVTVTDSSGERLWYRELNNSHAGWGGIYLYERDGQTYLMEWLPHTGTGSSYYSYRVFALCEPGIMETMTLAENSFEYSFVNEQQILAIDITAMRAFEAEINALLADTMVLLVMDDSTGGLRYSTADDIRTEQWTSPADQLEAQQQAIRDSQTAQETGDKVLSTWSVDLNHDGAEEIVTVRQRYTEAVGLPWWDVTVTDADGTQLWWRGVDSAHVGWNGIYLYEADGNYYLMEWLPAGSTGGYAYRYHIFSLGGGDGTEEITLAEGLFTYFTNSREEVLAIDIAAMRAFEAEVNAYLADAIVLLVMDDSTGGLRYSAAGDIRTEQWACPADRWEAEQQAIRDSQASYEASVRFRMEVDLHHGGGAETLVVLEQDTGDYIIQVRDGDFIYWESKPMSQFGEQLVYTLCEIDGKTYLGEFGGTNRQGVGMWHYKVFSLMPEWEEILYEEELYYEATSVDTLVAVDIDAIRAFEERCNQRMGGTPIIAYSSFAPPQIATNFGGELFRCDTGEPERLEQLREAYRQEAAATAEVLGWVDRITDSENPQLYRWLSDGSGPTGMGLPGYGDEIREIFARRAWRYHDGSYNDALPWLHADLAENGLATVGVVMSFYSDHITVETVGSDDPPVSYTTDDVPGLVAELSRVSGAPYMFLWLAEVPGDSISDPSQLPAAYAEAFRRDYLASGKALDVNILSAEYAEQEGDPGDTAIYESAWKALTFEFEVLPADPAEPCWDGILTASNWYRFTYRITVRLEEDGVWRYD